MLDETWGLKDGEDNETAKNISKRNSEPIDDQFEKEFNGERISLESISSQMPLNNICLILKSCDNSQYRKF